MTLRKPLKRRHIGPSHEEQNQMLGEMGFSDLGSFVDDAIPQSIRSGEFNGDGTKTKLRRSFSPVSETEILGRLKKWEKQNQVFKSYIGMGYSPCETPGVIRRNILENPGWYTQYTPYQAEISQGRLEALLNFQTMIQDLTDLDIANASLLDEATAAAEAMGLFYSVRKQTTTEKRFFIAQDCHPQTIAVIQTRAKPLGIKVDVGGWENADFDSKYFGALVQYPTSDGVVNDYSDFISRAQSKDCRVILAADLLSLTLLTSPGEMGADACVGSSQRFGVSLGFGGPHAAFFATRDEFKRKIPGRIVGVSRDAKGNLAYRLALQTREQHIRREKATSNICTAQVLLAIMASMYAVYHGPEGLKKKAWRIHLQTVLFVEALEQLGYSLSSDRFFDTVVVQVNGKKEKILSRAQKRKINLRYYDGDVLGVSFNETVTENDLSELISVFDLEGKFSVDLTNVPVPRLGFKRKSSFFRTPRFSSIPFRDRDASVYSEA